MLLIIHRRSHDFTGIGDGAKQVHVGKSLGGTATRRRHDGIAKRRQHRNENIVLREGITAAGQIIQNGSNVAYGFVFDQAEPIFVKLAESHE